PRRHRGVAARSRRPVAERGRPARLQALASAPGGAGREVHPARCRRRTLARRRADQTAAGGGEGIPSPRRARGALAAAGAATAVAGWLAAWPVLLSDGDRARLFLLLGVAGVVALVAGTLVGHFAPVAAAIGLLGGAYTLHLVLDRPSLDPRSALFGAGLLLAAELGHWSLELRREVSREPGRAARRLAAELALCVGGLLVAALVLAAADLGRVGGTAIEIAGVAAAVALVWLAVRALSPVQTGSDRKV